MRVIILLLAMLATQQKAWKEVEEDQLAEQLWKQPQNVVLFMPVQSEELQQVFAQAAQEIRVNQNQTELLFSIVKSSSRSVSFRKYKIGEEVTMLLFDKERIHRYAGAWTVSSVSDYLNSLVNSQLDVLSSMGDFSSFMQEHEKTSRVLCVYEKSQEKEIALITQLVLNQVFRDSGDYAVAMAHDQSIVPYPSSVQMPCLVLYNPQQQGEEPTDLVYPGGLLDSQELMDWLNLNSLPLVTRYTPETAYRLFAGPVPRQALLFVSEGDQGALQEFREAGRQNRDELLLEERVMFAVVVVDSQQDTDFLASFGVSSDTVLPRVMGSVLDIQNESMLKYLMTSRDFTQEGITEWLHQVHRQAEDVYYYSQPSVPLSPGAVQVAVGEDFHEKVTVPSRPALVLFCSLDLQFEELCRVPLATFAFYAQHLLSLYPDYPLSFFSLDLYRNELPDLSITNMPTLVYYQQGIQQDQLKEVFHLESLTGYLNTVLKNVDIQFSPEHLRQFNYQQLSPQDQRLFKSHFVKEGAQREEEQRKEEL